MDNDKLVLDVENVDWRRQHPGGDFDADIKDLSDWTKSEKLGFRLYRLEPGKTAWPFHAHLANEEFLFIQQGQGTLRYGDDEYEVTAGDCISLPADPDGAHQLINTSNSELRYLCVSTMIEPDAIRYPDSDKVGVFAGEPPGGESDERSFQGMFDALEQKDYWDGEVPEDEGG